MKIFILVREDCTAYGTMGGDHCRFSVEEIHSSQEVARNRLALYQELGKKENEARQVRKDEKDWNIKYLLSELELNKEIDLKEREDEIEVEE